MGVRYSSIIPDEASSALTSVSQKFSTITSSKSQDDVLITRLIDFNNFKNCNKFPRYPDDKNLCIDAAKSGDIIGRALIVFISHAWLRESPSCPDFDGHPHPDTKGGDSFRLCVEGIERLKNTFAPRLDCYVFCDFSCLDKDTNYYPYCFDFHTLRNAIGISDCIFTPIVDLDVLADASRRSRFTFGEYMERFTDKFAEQSKEPSPRKEKEKFSYLKDYKSANWNGKRGYLNRSWCRLEMFYAANIPFRNVSQTLAAQAEANPEGSPNPSQQKFQQNETATYCIDCNSSSGSGLNNASIVASNKLEKMTASLKDRISKGERPHFIYGQIESIERAYPIMLPQISNSLWYECDEMGFQQYTSYDPMTCLPYDESKGLLFNLALRWKTYMLKRGLQPYIDSKKIGYQGSYLMGRKHGKGISRFADGSVFEGMYFRNRRKGRGVCRYASGDQFEGIWKGNKIRKGQYRFSSGNVYEGEYLDGLRHGKGTFKWSSGAIYEGEYSKGKRHGLGLIKLQNGDVFEGEFSNGQSVGKGIFRMLNGDVYEGDFLRGTRHGSGLYKWKLGLVYEGMYKFGMKEGRGVMRFPCGDVYEGAWCHDVFEGEGKFTWASGEVYEGDFFEGKRQGSGKFLFANGSVFSGKFENDNMVTGALMLRYTDPDTGEGRVNDLDEVEFTVKEEKERELQKYERDAIRKKYFVEGKKNGLLALKGTFYNGKILDNDEEID